jgi:hypothetical protein
MTTQTVITPAHLVEAYTYEAFIALSEELYVQNRTTSDADSYNTEQILQYTRLNLQRISRLERTTTLNPELAEAASGVQERWVWMVLAESWCGDVAQNLPVIKQIADLGQDISVRVLLRDKNLDVMDAYLTNGSRSIPKLICLRASDLSELGTWGPRPAALQELMLEWKAQNIPFEELAEKIHGWYAKDRSQHLQTEFLQLIKQWQKAGQTAVL